jgi:hypothetical protein
MMTIPPFLIAADVATPKIDYKWTAGNADNLLTSDADTQPSLGKAVGRISARAAFSLSLASCEWIAARLSGLVDTTDAFMRIEAGWAAAISPEYARLPVPRRTTADVDPALDALHLAMVLLSRSHDFYVNQQTGGMFISCIRLLLLAELVAGRNHGFKTWLPSVLKRLAKTNPDRKMPLSDQAPVARTIFDSVGPPQKSDATAMQARFLKGLNPESNPYLRPAVLASGSGSGSKPVSRARTSRHRAR